MSIVSGFELRKKTLEALNEIGQEQIALRSEEVSRKFLSLFGLSSELKGLRVAIYSALPGEFELKLIETAFRDYGAKLHYPRIYDRDLGLLEFVEVASDANVKWKKGPFGINEPDSTLPASDPRSMDVIFVPSVALGKNGERVGKGAGFYDRVLPKATKALRLALGFDLQIQPTIEQQPWDQRLDWWMTETQEFRSQKAQDWLDGMRGKNA